MATHVPFITADTMQPCVFTCQNVHSASMCEWRSLQHRLTDQSAADAIWFLKKQSLNFIIKKVRSFHILKTNLSHLGTARHQGDELVLFFHLEKLLSTWERRRGPSAVQTDQKKNQVQREAWQWTQSPGLPETQCASTPRQSGKTYHHQCCLTDLLIFFLPALM